ncbi:MAG: exodeoxyribonuclease III [Muribaculaceae bacterium]|nr:exodeoxyribonuclease III [Muribaculaceae bacterium]
MTKEQEILHNASVLDLMMMLDKLHRKGYEKLRWFSYMSPNGCALRCHITTADNIVCNRDIENFDDNLLSASIGVLDGGTNIDDYVNAFFIAYPKLAEAGKGKDSSYRTWYKEVLALAKKGKVPEFNGDFYSAPLGKIRIAEEFFPAPPGSLKIISWNIDGLKAKWDALNELVKNYSPDVICLQKVRHSGEVIPLDGYRCFLCSAPYAGVCTYIKSNLVANFDEKIQETPIAVGYLQKFSFLYPSFTLFNCYVPYSNPDVVGAIEHRQIYDKFLLSQVKKTPDRIVICGDMNIVHGGHDCWDGKYKRNQANFHDWERRDFEKLLDVGQLVDTYRLFHIWDKEFSYFFRNDPKVRENNQGHRIDYFLASKSLIPNIQQAEIVKDITASTNNPILLTIDY